MEVIIGLVIVAGVLYFGYKAMNKEKADGSHPLDAVTPKVDEVPYKVEPPQTDIMTGMVVSPTVVETPAPVAEPVNPQITDAVTQEPAPAKKPRKPRTPKAEVKPAKEKAAKPKKAAAMKPAKKSKKA